MKRYIQQLSVDIDTTYAIMQDIMLNDAYEDVIDEREYTQTIKNTKELKCLSQVTGLSRNALPPTHLLSNKERSYLGRKLESLLWVCNFIITVPVIFTSSQRYSFIREIWDNKYMINKGGLFIVSFYTLHSVYQQ